MIMIAHDLYTPIKLRQIKLYIYKKDWPCDKSAFSIDERDRNLNGEFY